MSDAFDKSVDMIARCNAEIKSLRKGNRDLQLHFDVLKADYDRLRHEVGRLQALISDAKEAIDADDAIAAYRILDRQPAPSGWRPIETAPKDGTRVIVAKYGAHSLAQEKAGDCWWACKAYFDGDCWTDGMDDLCTPTHWMPLPPATGGQAMSDIVERLRKENSMPPYYGVPKTQADAADEIERLREQIDAAKEAIDADDVIAAYHILDAALAAQPAPGKEEA